MADNTMENYGMTTFSAVTDQGRLICPRSGGQDPSTPSMIAIDTGPVDVGWSKFTVRLGSSGWTCQASYICSHPLRDLILAAVDIYDHIFVAPLPTENAVWDAVACDEPGGIVVRAIPIERQVRVSLYDYTDGTILWADSNNRPEIPAAGNIVVDYWDFADAVFMDAARAVVRHGFTGFRDGWTPNRWDADSHFEVLPVEHFLFLAGLTLRRQPTYRMTLDEELELLNEIKLRGQQ